MKTNVVMTRKMGNFDIFQRTEDGMFNATSLLSQWNKKRGLSRGKEVNDFLKIDKTKEFIAEVELRENHNTNKIVLSKKGKNGGTWLHPLVFIDFAIDMCYITSYQQLISELRKLYSNKNLKF